VPVVTNALGEKLSKQTGALGFDLGNNDVLQDALIPAAGFLNLKFSTSPANIADFWLAATVLWANKMGIK
jgi:glutamyl-Q tRNA(Asp) synthetase